MGTRSMQSPHWQRLKDEPDWKFSLRAGNKKPRSELRGF